MSLTRRVYGGKKSRNSKKGRGHCRIGGKKTLKKGGKRVLSLGGKSLKNRKKSKRRSKRGGADGGPLGAVTVQQGDFIVVSNDGTSPSSPLLEALPVQLGGSQTVHNAVRAGLLGQLAHDFNPFF